ncbi:MAG: thermonuclease family protein [Magnetococcales bacterium]|nr:thermonuclease family protein [Magnetococcales bacterium]NGZ06784.1 thermonuclease family protein [Magnetococcales bacterium]
MCAPGMLAAGEWRGRVERVLDGDTLRVERAKGVEKIRLAGVDTPEHGQPFAEEARTYAVRLVEKRLVWVREKERDRFGRLVAWVTPEGGEELGLSLVRAGLAWRHQYFSDDHQLKRLEQSARSRRIGLWSDPQPTPPWVWKQTHPRRE